MQRPGIYDKFFNTVEVRSIVETEDQNDSDSDDLSICTEKEKSLEPRRGFGIVQYLLSIFTALSDRSSKY